MNDQEIIEKHKILDSILHLNDGFMWQDVLRAFGGFIVSALSWFNRTIETIVTKFITLNDFYKTGAVGAFMDNARPFIWVVFFVALVVLGFQFMFNKIEKRNEVLLNIVMALCFIVIIPDLMSNIQKIVGAGIEEIKPKNESLASNMIKSNVADLLYYAEKNFEFANGTSRGDANTPPRPFNKDNNTGTPDYTFANRLSATHDLKIPYTQKLDLHDDDGWIFKADWVKGLSKSSKDVLSHKSVPTGVGKGYQVEELAKNKIRGTEIGRETYYRYHVNWFTLIMTLLITNFALAITAIKIGRSIFDLAFHQIFGVFIAASDLTGGQRTKKVLIEILNTFVVMAVMIALIQLFILFVTWANSWRYEVGTLGVIILLIAGAWALIDAPDIVQRQLGIDAGLRNGWQAMMGAYAASKVASGGAKALGGAGMKSAATAGGGANFMRRMVQGMRTQAQTPISSSSSTQTGQRGASGVPKVPSSQNGGTGGQSTTGQQQGNSGVGPTSQGSQAMPTSNNNTGNAGDSAQGTTQAAQNNTNTSVATVPATPTNQGASEGTKEQNGQGSLSSQQRAEQRAQRRNQSSDATKGQTSNQSANTVPSKQVNGDQQTAIPANDTPINKTDVKEMPTQDSSQNIGQKGGTEIPSSGAVSQGNQNTISPSEGTPNSQQQKVAEIPSNKTGGQVAQGGNTPTSAQNSVADTKGHKETAATIPTNESGPSNNQVDIPAIPTNQSTSTVQQPTNAPAVNNESTQSIPSETSTGGTNQEQRQNRRQQHMAQRATNQLNVAQQTPHGQSNQAPFGHKQAVHKNTIIGGNRNVQKLKEQVTRAGNSGFTLGQNIRRATNVFNKKDKKDEGGNK
ncbi:pLS20_p028 family conjugation system transmembrane protein [Metasolibacillus sp.]|uniref:pLS20_p028 family conjugation system transmembrane protein n=1 Tax=Metasolibacillus sp. TaxID=2703680 RepID=UPI0025DA9733|nr:hypothetical protein [Metasolibacillus sp.]MCT6922816.1 hypothetical protein [Metasolibacillus sp.]MCT6938845.1 hypothetical protein [Metasolibacillus sp.]